jgi:hypothetical protein
MILVAMSESGFSLMPYVPDQKEQKNDAIKHLIEQPYHEYWFHLGRFIHAFATAEAELLFLLRDISGLSQKRAGVIFNGSRSEGARELINSLLSATDNKEKKKRLERPFSQMASIATVRNNLVHWRATTEIGEKFMVSNLSRSPINPKEYVIATVDFSNMCDDLSNITMLISCEREKHDQNKDFRGSIARIPWRYKPPQPPPNAKTKNRDRAK